MKNKKIAIIGLGLIGGSLAKALDKYLGIKDIIAVDSSVSNIDLAINEGIIKQGFAQINQNVFDSDIIFICTPVKQTIGYLASLNGNVNSDCIITDVGSTKSEIISHINDMAYPFCFVGGHPMAGTEQSGYSSSFAHLFENAYYVLTPCINTDKSSLDILIDIVKGIGAIPIVMDANQHDKIAGCISHVPHIIASALVNMLKELDTSDESMKMLAAGGFKDITRIASSSPEMWENIVLYNKNYINEILITFENILHNFKNSLELNNSKEILDFFRSAKTYRDSISSMSKGLISSSFELYLDVVDKPGIISEVATILSMNNINIKNINITNSREFEQGCLKITLSDIESVNIAFDLLDNTGYKVYKSR